MIRYSYLFVALLFQAPLAKCGPDSALYSMQRYTDENGLPQNSVKSLAQDESGFLWLATEDGLVRFDGRNFRIFNKNNLATTTNRFRYIEHDRSTGKLYATNESDESFFLNLGNALPFAERKIRVLKEKAKSDQENTFWAHGIQGTDMNAYNVNKRFAAINIPLLKGQYYQCFKDRVVLRNSAAGQTTTLAKTPDLTRFFTLDNQLFYLDGQGHCLDFSNGKASKIPVKGAILSHRQWRKNAAPFELFWNINTSNFICLRLGRSLYKAVLGADKAIHTSLLLDVFDFEENQISQLFLDESRDIIWMGSQNKGLFKFTKRGFATVHFNPQQNDEVYYAQTAYSDRSVLTPDGKILGTSSSGESFALRGTRMQSTKNSMVTDRFGNIWVSYGNELSKLDHSFRHIAKWTLKGIISVIFEGTDGFIYLGMQKSGLARVSQARRDAPEYIDENIEAITCLQALPSNMLLAGTSKGLFQIDLTVKKARRVIQVPKVPIRSLYIPSPYDKIWITSSGDGFFLLEKNTLTKFPLDKDNYLATAHCITEDQNHFFWITTNKGLFKVARKDLIDFARRPGFDPFYLYYNKVSGFSTNEFNGGCQPCTVKLANDQFSLPSLNGLVFFNPQTLKSELPGGSLFVDQIQVDNQSVALSEQITIKPSFSTVTLFLSTAYYGAAQNVHLQYCIANKDVMPQWDQVGNDGIIHFQNLGSGDFQVMIRKQNGFGQANFIHKQVHLTVLYPFYKTWWFGLVMLLAVSLLLFIAVKYRINSLKKQNRLQEIRIAERTQTLQITLQTLEVSQDKLLGQMFMLERLLGTISHDIKTPLLFLTRSSKRLVKLHEIQAVDASIVSLGQSNYEYSEHLLNLTNNLLEYIKPKISNQITLPEMMGVFQLFQEKIALFTSVAAVKKTVIINQISPYLRINSTLNIVGIIVHNLLDNAIKATKNGKVTISSRVNEHETCILITDSGRGMSSETILWVNQPAPNFKASRDKALLTGHNGIGLIMVKELAGLIDVRIHARSGLAGTTMTLIFKVENTAIIPVIQGAGSH